MHRRGIRPDHILFADVGAEKQSTYDYLPIIQAWLKQVGFPPVTVVRNPAPQSPYDTIEGNMAMNSTLPGATFNMGSCTLKWKVEPQNRYTNKLEEAKAAWAAGGMVTKFIGFEAGEEYRSNSAADKAHIGAGAGTKDKYDYQYILQDWGWTREQCKVEIAAEGLPVPPKSACYICPNAKEWEVIDMSPEERGRIMRVEVLAGPYNRKVHGLWRTPRKHDGRPGSMTQWILEQGLEFVLPSDIMAPNPKCQRADQGFTFKPPHDAPDLRLMLKERGLTLLEHQVYGPEFVRKDIEALEIMADTAKVRIKRTANKVKSMTAKYTEALAQAVVDGKTERQLEALRKKQVTRLDEYKAEAVEAVEREKRARARFENATKAGCSSCNACDTVPAEAEIKQHEKLVEAL